MLCITIGIITFNIIVIIIIAIMYVINMLIPLACLLKKFFFFVFFNMPSIFLQGRYNMYAINIPAKMVLELPISF